MAIYTAKELAELFAKHPDQEDTFAITWWSKEDVERFLGETSHTDLDDLWYDLIDEADDALENTIGDVNDRIEDFVRELILDNEPEDE